MTVHQPTTSCRTGAYALRDLLDGLYEFYNRPEYIHPDPLEFVHLYTAKSDKEVVGLVASALAYGRVKQILCSVRSVLDTMGPSPRDFLLQHSPARIRSLFHSFKHRFTTGEILSSLLIGIRKLTVDYGSIESCFLGGFDRKDTTILPALCAFVKKLNDASGREMPMFLPSPAGGSACKRLNLFLRWMVRRDNVDPGIWQTVSPACLIVPLDTHMHRVSLAMGLTARKQADLRCAIEITEQFASVCPEDPVRYDFALTRLGMNGEPNPFSAIFPGEASFRFVREKGEN